MCYPSINERCWKPRFASALSNEHWHRGKKKSSAIMKILYRDRMSAISIDSPMSTVVVL